MTTDAAKELIAKHVLHVEQVQKGLIPADSPPTFTLPEGPDALDERGLPWFYGPDYHPNPEALESFAQGPGENSSPSVQASQTSPEDDSI